MTAWSREWTATKPKKTANLDKITLAVAGAKRHNRTNTTCKKIEQEPKFSNGTRSSPNDRITITKPQAVPSQYLHELLTFEKFSCQSFRFIDIFRITYIIFSDIQNRARAGRIRYGSEDLPNFIYVRVFVEAGAEWVPIISFCLKNCSALSDRARV